MSDSAPETVEADRLPDSTPRATLEPAGMPDGDHGLRLGEPWNELTIEAPWPAGGPRAFIAEHSQSMKKVVVRAMPIVNATEWRRGAWERLLARPDLQMVRSISAEEEGGWRYEITAVPPATTLKEWLACHRPGFTEIEALVRQLAATLGALHAQGVVHLNICPSSIFIDESGPEPLFVLGGLHEATLYTQPELMPSDIDPLYAPPEAARCAQHPPGTRLCAWDWWSTGRVIQEFLLGRHVLGAVLDRDVSRVTEELRARAELLLLEREPAGARAGALEYMTIEPGLLPLLRGLLTGSCEARWGLDAVQRWLRHETVQDHYDLPRHARFWVYRGRGFTVAEAANHFTQTELWDQGEEMLFQRDRPETLAAFLADSPAHRADAERLHVVCDLSESATWGDVPVVARRTVTAALAWLSLANGSGVRTPLRIRGETVDVVGLTELLRKSGPEEGVALFTALLTPVVISFVESFDASAARTLKLVASKGGEAIQHGVEHAWLDPHDEAGRARIYELALKAGALLRDPIDLLRSTYVTNPNAALATLLTEKNPSPRNSVILAFTAESPERYGYITHEAWKRQRCVALKSDAERIVAALLWIRLRQLLRFARIWGTPTPYFAAMVLGVTVAVAWLSRSAGPASAVAGFMLLSRVYFWSRTRWLVRKFDPAGAPWLWANGIARAMKEADRAMAGHKMHAGALEPELKRLQTTIAGIFEGKSDAPKIEEPRWWDLWAASALTSAVTFGTVVVLFVNWIPALTTPDVRLTNDGPPQAVAELPAASAPEPTLWGVDPSANIDALVATGKYEVIDDGFGRQLRGPLRQWTFYAEETIHPLEIIARAPASAEQSAFALVSSTLLVDPYPRKGVNVLLAVRVPTTRGFGVLVFNTRDRKLLDHEVLLVSEPLKAGAWYQFGSRRIGYLGTPAGLETEISLAPP